MEIDGLTRTIGLIGNPVEHTLSPVIHNNISEKMGISSVYVPFRVENEGLLQAVRGAYELNILGLNVTVPHKNAVMECLVDIDEAARNIGAVNTLVRDENNHGYKGYNTDYMGLERQIKEDGLELTGKTVVILGAGGAAKAVTYMCVKNGAAKIYILNRTVDKARQIALDIGRLSKANQKAENNGQVSKAGQKAENNGQVSKAWQKTENIGHVSQAELSVISCVSDSNSYCEIIPLSLSEYSTINENELIAFQATSIGLFPKNDEVVIDDPDFYKKITVGVDLIYNPATTRFMKLVKENGGRAYNALKMLLYQGVIAFELWHDIKVPDEVIEEIYVELKRRVYRKDNIVLIGFMGSGKSTVGKALADKLSMDFIDTDEYIVNETGMSIAEIFEKKGEAEFRRIETKTLSKLRDSLNNTVLATGGGVPLRRENALLLKEIGKVFYLTAANRTIYDRVKDDTKRPLLKCDDPYAKICAMMKERGSLYEKACDKNIDTNSNDLEEVLEAITQELER